MISATHESIRNSLDPETQLHMTSLQESLMNSQLNFNHSAAPQNYIHQNVDFAKVFDNDDLNQLFYESFKHDSLEPTPLGGGSGLSKSNSLDGLAFLCNSGLGGALNSAFHQQTAPLVNNNNFSLPQATSTFDSPIMSNNQSSMNHNATSSNQSSNPFVNVMLIVDPTTQKVICPRQTLQYQNGLKTESHIVGPAVLDNVNQAQGIDIQQLLHQQVFGSNVPTANTTLGTSGLFSTHSITPPPMSNSDQASSRSSKGTVLEPTELPPLRALSAYNFFFRDERERVLNGGSQELTEDKASQLLQDHWGRDRTKKRRHRKTHGKIDFTTLSKLISTRWKELPEQDKEFYRQVAAKDWERYQRELGEHKSKVHQAHVERHQSVVENHLAVVA